MYINGTFLCIYNAYLYDYIIFARVSIYLNTKHKCEEHSENLLAFCYILI